jgi:hypothetical protein
LQAIECILAAAAAFLKKLPEVIQQLSDLLRSPPVATLIIGDPINGRLARLVSQQGTDGLQAKDRISFGYHAVAGINASFFLTARFQGSVDAAFETA